MLCPSKTLITGTLGIEYMSMVHVMFATKSLAPPHQAKEDLSLPGEARQSTLALITYFCVSSKEALVNFTSKVGSKDFIPPVTSLK